MPSKFSKAYISVVGNPSTTVLSWHVSLFVCVGVYVCHDVCPDNLTVKDWCHTNDILQVHCWGCLVVQVMFHSLMTSLMTSRDLKVGPILKLIYLRQYLSYSVDQKLKMSEMIMAIFLVHSTSGIASGKKSLPRAQNSGHFENFWLLNTASIWPQIWKDRPKLCKKKVFYGDDVIDDVTGWPQSFSLSSCLGEVGPGSKLQGQCLVNKCQYHNYLSRLNMPQDDLNE